MIGARFIFPSRRYNRFILSYNTVYTQAQTETAKACLLYTSTDAYKNKRPLYRPNIVQKQLYSVWKNLHSGPFHFSVPFHLTAVFLQISIFSNPIWADAILPLPGPASVCPAVFSKEPRSAAYQDLPLHRDRRWYSYSEVPDLRLLSSYCLYTMW